MLEFCVFLGSFSLLICAVALYMICKQLATGVIKVSDVDRAKVYGEHLGQKLRGAETPVQRKTE